MKTDNKTLTVEELREEFCKKEGYSYLHINDGAYKDYIDFLEANITEYKQSQEQAIRQEREKWKEETKQEVLEALERELSICWDKASLSLLPNGNGMSFEEYYETEVKQRIESK